MKVVNNKIGDAQSLPQGYKQTEVGVIPEDWEVKEIDQILTFGSGQDYKHLKKGEVPVYGTGGVMTYVNSHLYEGESVGIGRKGTIDKPVFLSGRFWTVDTLFYSHSFINVIPRLIFFTFLTIPWKEYNEASGVPSLNKNTLGRIKIALPPTLTEQKAIATALSDVDALITSLDQLITKKKAIKQGTMQELLTPPNTCAEQSRSKGGKRLPGFDGEWVEKNLGDVCEITKGQLITEKTRVDGIIPVIAGGKSAAYYHNKPNRFGSTITISGSGANAGYVSFHSYPIFASDCSTIEEAVSYSIKFIYFFLKLKQNDIYNAQTGGAQPHIHPSDLNPMEIDLPQIDEQKAIAKILSDMDKEIEQLEAKKAKYQQIKQGMMQELLTGKTRLV